jgi:LysR family transcriptional regulator, glycine cleavage system transcriptional activator
VNILHHMKMRIPPMNTLEALDALARLGSVWEAAEELGISRSGVSHRLAMLEEILGFELATRAGTGVVLTPRGKSYADEVRKSLALLANAQEGRASRDIEGQLRISSTAGFSSMWLCKHIATFRAEHPNIWLQIVSALELDEVAKPDVDLFIAFGDGKWPKHWVQHLYDVEFTPMCSPALLNAPGGLREPSDVLRFPLLMRRWDDWTQWLNACNVQVPKQSAGIGFSDMILVQTAAIAGQGIMLGDETTCAGALASGQLVVPFATTINSQRGYYLVRHRHRRASPATLAFTRWLTILLSRTDRQ